MSRNAPPGASTVEWSPGADDGRPERENMKNWTMEQLYDLWRDRGYTKKCFTTKSKPPPGGL